MRSSVEMKSLIRVVIILGLLKTFTQAYLNFHYLEEPKVPGGPKGPEESKVPVPPGPKEPEGPKTSESPFQRMAMVVSEVSQSPNWNSLTDEQKKVVARFLFEMVANPPRFSPFGG